MFNLILYLMPFIKDCVCEPAAWYLFCACVYPMRKCNIRKEICTHCIGECLSGIHHLTSYPKDMFSLRCVQTSHNENVKKKTGDDVTEKVDCISIMSVLQLNG